MTLTLPRRALVDPDELPPLSLRASVPQPFAPTSAEPDALDGFELGREWLRKLNWGLFETLVETAFSRDGFLVLPAPARLAGRADMVLERRGERLFVQCKHWKAWQVGTPTVRELQALVSLDRATGGIVITAGKYSVEALAFAGEVGLILLDGDDLLRMAVGAPVLPLAEETTTQWRAPAAWTAFGAPTCPVCEAPMLYKRVRMGAHAGTRFWGCPGFPTCRAVREAGPGTALPMERPVAGAELSAVAVYDHQTPPATADSSTPMAQDPPAAAPVIDDPAPAEVEFAADPPKLTEPPVDQPGSPNLTALVESTPNEPISEPAEAGELLLALLAPEPTYAEPRPRTIQPAPLRAPTFGGALAPPLAWPPDTFRAVPPAAVQPQPVRPQPVRPSPAQPASVQIENPVPGPAAPRFAEVEPQLATAEPETDEGGHRRSTVRLMAVILICAAAAVVVAAAVPAVLQVVRLLTR
ncbi:restriction endonuclease [Propionicimonas sp.]|uniref:restriction endonuclease n=1 Tax=Propionicimonas sp. TaxID=1955623 RepID=UPI00184D72E7|nr:restriction endonuclease [Propionicimonas sp.]MBU3977327.1 restriction endonuclease [Actinomycetota bacterium]MBA3021252.1 hypothetical protein [Propionicimonas sp.]MBU3985837.1 restriction endonuclease [Actinomycetota bacterium]MBU4008622.1 restriction endonuclease [Actinomycetota bacterium]MBU4066228.1 restriction endonuclease [Actinomycetota bacterium]